MKTTSAPLRFAFAPRTVALIGASEKTDSVGRGILENLRDFSGDFYAINPGRQFVLDRRSYPSLADAPGPIDLAVIAVPAAGVPDVVRECGRQGVRSAIVISAGFREAGPTGQALEARVLAEARRGHVRLIGPNCLGLINPRLRLNATFGASLPRAGHVAFLSQSGALGSALLDWAGRENFGFSAFVSVGSMADVGWGELIMHFGQDPATRCLLLYMESVENAPAFLAAAARVAREKPIIVLKAGRTAEAARAAASHTGALAGRDEVFDAALHRIGVLRVDTVSELSALAEALSCQPLPRGKRLAIVTNAGGPAALATDAAVLAGGELAELSRPTRGTLNRILPPNWSHGDPVDVLGDSTPPRFVQAAETLALDPAVDGVLAILTPQSMTDPDETARRLAATARGIEKPLLACWMGGDAVAGGKRLLREAGIPAFDYPETAARVFSQMADFAERQRTLLALPPVTAAPIASAAHADAEMIAHLRRAGQTVLPEYDSKLLLARHGIATVPTHLAATVDEAVAAAERCGYPVVLKLHSRTLTHKSDFGGVQLNLRDAAMVREAWWRIRQSVYASFGRTHFLGVTVQPMISGYDCELILGSSCDPQFGPVLLFGAGGRFVESIRDYVLALPPLDRGSVRHLVDQTRIGAVLKGARHGVPADLDQLEHTLAHLARLVLEQPGIKDIEINPLVWTGGRFLALDARVILQPSGLADADLPRPALVPTLAPKPASFPASRRSRRPAARKSPLADQRPAIAASGARQRLRAHLPRT